MNIYEIIITKLLQIMYEEIIINYEVLKETAKGLTNLKISMSI